MTLVAALVYVLTLQAPTAAGQAGYEVVTPNTIRMAVGTESPAATLADMAWLAGSWTGQGLGGVTEEMWSAPTANAMMGMFRLIKADAVVFYEFLTLVPDGRSIVLKLKHFNPDLTGWEEKDKFVTFHLAKIEVDAIYFEGLTFRRLDADTLQIFLGIRDRATGKIREEEFKMARPHLR